MRRAASLILLGLLLAVVLVVVEIVVSDDAVRCSALHLICTAGRP